MCFQSYPEGALRVDGEVEQLGVVAEIAQTYVHGGGAHAGADRHGGAVRLCERTGAYEAHKNSSVCGEMRSYTRRRIPNGPTAVLLRKLVSGIDRFDHFCANQYRMRVAPTHEASAQCQHTLDHTESCSNCESSA